MLLLPRNNSRFRRCIDGEKDPLPWKPQSAGCSDGIGTALLTL
jgi:hypothetical protein